MREEKIYEVKDEDKTKQQLIDELVQLRKRIAELEELHAAREQAVRIGEILIEMGYVTSPQLEEALRKQKDLAEQGQSPMRLASVMIKLGFINTDQMSDALSLQEERVRNMRLKPRKSQDDI